jgi:CheY-like chemotaxis protein
MALKIYVRVVGFRDVERHALNSVFRLSNGRAVSYALWSPDAPEAPRLALIDLESYESGIELASPGLNPEMKMICVGGGVHTQATHSFLRPLHWPEVVRAMDSLFVSAQQLEAGLDFNDTSGADLAAAPSRLALLVAPLREDRMYLRARLALAGMALADDAATGEQALMLSKLQRYDLVLVSLEVVDMDGWELIRQLVLLEPAIGSVIAISSDTSWLMQEQAQASGCVGLLTKPFEPKKVDQLLQKV